jgi:hypothetical protein
MSVLLFEVGKVGEIPTLTRNRKSFVQSQICDFAKDKSECPPVNN